MLAGNMAKSLRKPLRSVWVRRVWIRKYFTATAARKKIRSGYDTPTWRSYPLRYMKKIWFTYMAKMLKPPSTTATVPVTNEAASLIK